MKYKYVEDILEELYPVMIWKKPFLADWDKRFIQDVADKTLGGNNLSSKQAEIVIKIFHKHKNHMANILEIDKTEWNQFLQSPQYRRKPYPSIEIKRECKYIGRRKLAFKFKYNPNIKDDIKGNGGTVWFNRTYKLWIIEVDKKNVDHLMELIEKYKFEVDEETIQFFFQCKNINPGVEVSDNSGKWNFQIQGFGEIAEYLENWKDYELLCGQN